MEKKTKTQHNKIIIIIIILTIPFHFPNPLPIYKCIISKQSCPRSIAEVPFDLVMRFWASLLLHTTCVRSCCTWRASCVVTLKKNLTTRTYHDDRFRVQGPLRECRSNRSGVSVLPYYRTPPVCVPDVIDKITVWLQNTKQKKTIPTNMTCSMCQLRECRSIRSDVSGLPYYCTPLVCVPDVIGGLAVCRHHNHFFEKTKSPGLLNKSKTLSLRAVKIQLREGCQRWHLGFCGTPCYCAPYVTIPAVI